MKQLIKFKSEELAPAYQNLNRLFFHPPT